MSYNDLATLMEERPDGIEPDQADEFLEGFSVVTPAEGEAAGMIAHRGVLHPDEYVDFFELRRKVEAGLGVTYAQVSAAYSMGRPTAHSRQLRDKIDSRLLALSRAGGNMTLLAKVLALSEKTVDRALARARLQERAA